MPSATFPLPVPLPWCLVLQWPWSLFKEVPFGGAKTSSLCARDRFELRVLGKTCYLGGDWELIHRGALFRGGPDLLPAEE